MFLDTIISYLLSVTNLTELFLYVTILNLLQKVVVSALGGHPLWNSRVDFLAIGLCYQILGGLHNIMYGDTTDRLSLYLELWGDTLLRICYIKHNWSIALYIWCVLMWRVYLNKKTTISQRLRKINAMSIIGYYYFNSSIPVWCASVIQLLSLIDIDGLVENDTRYYRIFFTVTSLSVFLSVFPVETIKTLFKILVEKSNRANLLLFSVWFILFAKIDQLTTKIRKDQKLVSTVFLLIAAINNPLVSTIVKFVSDA